MIIGKMDTIGKIHNEIYKVNPLKIPKNKINIDMSERLIINLPIKFLILCSSFFLILKYFCKPLIYLKLLNLKHL